MLTYIPQHLWNINKYPHISEYLLQLFLMPYICSWWDEPPGSWPTAPYAGSPFPLQENFPALFKMIQSVGWQILDWIDIYELKRNGYLADHECHRFHFNTTAKRNTFEVLCQQRCWIIFLPSKAGLQEKISVALGCLCRSILYKIFV